MLLEIDKGRIRSRSCRNCPCDIARDLPESAIHLLGAAAELVGSSSGW